MPTLPPVHRTTPVTSHFRELNTAELAAIDGLKRKGSTVFRGRGVTTCLEVTYRFQRDGFCLCLIRGEVRNSPRAVSNFVIWTGVSKRAPTDPHNDIRGKMLAFVRAVQSTPATW
jgi:hypothetical protein